MAMAAPAKISETAAALGKGLVAGVVGTAAMTLSSTIEMKLRNRSSSSAPADAIEEVLGVEPVDEEAEQRLGNLTHWGYGSGWGAVRGLLGAFGLHGWPATAAHFGAVWGTEAAMLPALEVAPPMRKWGAKEIAIDMWHHAVYAVTAGLAYRALDRSSR